MYTEGQIFISSGKKWTKQLEKRKKRKLELDFK